MSNSDVMNYPVLMKHTERLAKIIKLSNRETWNLFDKEFSIILQKPILDFFKFDDFLAIPEESGKSMNDVIKERYPDDYDYIVKLLFS